MYPAFISIRIAHFAPSIKFLDNLDRQPGLGENPSHLIFLPRTMAHIDFGRAKRHKARQRQAGRACLLRERRGDHQPKGAKRQPKSFELEAGWNSKKTHLYFISCYWDQGSIFYPANRQRHLNVRLKRHSFMWFISHRVRVFGLKGNLCLTRTPV